MGTIETLIFESCNLISRAEIFIIPDQSAFQKFLKSSRLYFNKKLRTLLWQIDLKNIYYIFQVGLLISLFNNMLQHASRYDHTSYEISSELHCSVILWFLKSVGWSKINTTLIHSMTALGMDSRHKNFLWRMELLWSKTSICATTHTCKIGYLSLPIRSVSF